MDPSASSSAAGNNRDRSRSRARDRRVMCNALHIDENIAINGQPINNAREIVEGRLQQAPMSGNGQQPPRPGKRPIKNVSPADKVGAIDRVHEGESKASVARDIGVPESTLRGWCKSEQKIRSQCNNVSAEMMARHSPVNIGSRRSLSTSGRSVGSRHSSNSRQSAATPPNGDGAHVQVAKRPRLERSVRQNSPQTVMAGPSTSSAASFMSRMENHMMGGSASNYAALMSIADQNQILSQSATLHQLAGLQFPISTKDLLLHAQATSSRGGVEPTVGLVQNGLQYRTNNAANVSGIDNTHSAVSNMIGTAMMNGLNHANKNSTAIVAPTSSTSSSYKKSPNVTPAAEAPTTPAPASLHENNDQPSTSRGARNITATTATTGTYDSNNRIAQQAFWTWAMQQCEMQQCEMQRFNGSWFWRWVTMNKYAKDVSPVQLLNYLFNPTTTTTTTATTFSPASDDNSESRARSQSVASERSDSREEREDSSSTAAATAERATLTTPSVVESTLPPQVREILRKARTAPSNADIDKAIEYGTWLQEWLNNCSIPLLTMKQVLEHKYIVDVLKWVKNSQSTTTTTQTEVDADSCRVSAGSAQGEDAQL